MCSAWVRVQDSPVHDADGVHLSLGKVKASMRHLESLVQGLPQ